MSHPYFKVWNVFSHFFLLHQEKKKKWKMTIRMTLVPWTAVPQSLFFFLFDASCFMLIKFIYKSCRRIRKKSQPTKKMNTNINTLFFFLVQAHWKRLFHYQFFCSSQTTKKIMIIIKKRHILCCILNILCIYNMYTYGLSYIYMHVLSCLSTAFRGHQNEK